MKNMILILILSALIISACSPKTITIHGQRNIMGTTATITVAGSASEDLCLKQVLNATFDIISDYDRSFSTFRDDSPIYMLNENKVLENPDPELLYILDKSGYYYNITGGAFDITVQPLLDMWGKAAKGIFPNASEVNETRQLVGFDYIIYNENKVKIKPDMKITLGGIAKGYAIDKAVEYLIQHNVKDALVDIGGDVRAIGQKKNQQWSVALQNPRSSWDYLALIYLDDKSVATSGDYERFFVNKSIHHILNPKTGYSATELISVTVVADTAIDADALATSVFVLGPESGLQLIEDLIDTEALLVTKNKTVLKSSGFVW